MADSKNPPKPTVLGSFNLAEAMKKAEQEGPKVTPKAAPASPGHGKPAPQVGSLKAKGSAPKARQRSRIKV